MIEIEHKNDLTQRLQYLVGLELHHLKAISRSNMKCLPVQGLVMTTDQEKVLKEKV